ncbi:MAG: hypothetical protein B7Z40_06050 [Bosea sp. 12-68-7]|nr:MAG: hypothetical protein B7Z40_06050 [Bosea sp. 12-68-7]OYX00882.1 MAG: hypothetical protein B7Z14_07735 [Bosea sp. 32-68-6]
MIDLKLVIGFDWDQGNERKSVDKRHVSQAEQVFMNQPLLLAEDREHSVSEHRLRALGRTDEGRHLYVVFTLRRDRSLIRVISARDMNRKERRHYAQAA